MNNRVAKSEGLRPIVGFCCFTAALALLIAGCTTEAARQGRPGPSAGSGGGISGSGGSVDPGVKQGTECSLPNVTQQCKCEKNGKTFAGRQACLSNLKWGICECIDPDRGTYVYDGGSAGSNTGTPDAYKAVTFDWFRTMPGGSCKAGYYVGSFDGIYNSQAIVQWTLGFCCAVTVSGEVRVTIKEKEGSNGEFFEIADGQFKGTAMGFVPFQGEFVGELECSTRTFKGALKNCYYELGADKYGFQGIALSQYDTVNHAFVNGVWSVTEPEGNSVVYSPLVDTQIKDYSTLTFPDPVDVQPGTPLPTVFPDLAFKGGFGNWNCTWSADAAPDGGP